MISIAAIKTSLSSLLKKADDIDVFYTNVSKTDSEDTEMILSKYYFVSLIPISTSLFGEKMRDRAFIVDVSYINDDANENDFIAWSEKMDSLVLPYIKISNRSITIEESSFKIVEQVGHYIFTLKFRDNVEITDSGVPAKEMEIYFK